MPITRRQFAAVAATFFVPFSRSRRGPTCVYQTDKNYDDCYTGGCSWVRTLGLGRGSPKLGSTSGASVGSTWIW
jgi:hypothetical protein